MICKNGCKINLIFFTFLMLASCHEPAPQIPANKLKVSSQDEDMMLLNKEFAALENDEINQYIDSLDLDMKETGLGIRYRIVREGGGVMPEKGNTVTVNYSVRALNGDICERLSNITKTITLGRGELERGIEESVYLLNVSAKGEFVIPSYLAFGVTGLKGCIPPWTAVICEMTLLEKR
jgi:FKBP-type peptidyl-prolyl cis-trans isomerase